MPASWQTFTHAARHCSSVPYCCSNSASVSPCMIARIDPISCPSESILHRFRSGRKGGRLVDKREKKRRRHVALSSWPGRALPDSPKSSQGPAMAHCFELVVTGQYDDGSGLSIRLKSRWVLTQRPKILCSPVQQ